MARNYTVNGLNQYLSAGPASFGYDASGNLTSDGTSAYVYDAENRLVSSSASGGTTLSYDPLGRLWKIWSQQTGTTSFVYEGDHVSAEYDWAGTMLRRYFWGPGADEPIIQDEGGALNCTGTRFLHANHQGSIIAASNCDGNLTAINRYDEYGIPQGNWGRFQYTGQAWLPELGMYYYKARLYSATLGRFLQTDPIGYDDQVNLYAYVGNDPVNGTDPDGRCFQCFGALIGAVTEGIAIYADTQSGGSVSVREGIARVAISAGAGALGVGVAAKIGAAMKLTSLASKAIPAGTGTLKVGATLASGARGAVSGAAAAATTSTVGQSGKAAIGVGSMPSAKGIAGDAVVGAAAGGFAGAVVGSAQAAAAAGDVSAGASRSLSAQSAVAAEVPGLLKATISDQKNCPLRGEKC